MLKKILSILMLTMIATTTIVRAELWLPDSDDSDEGLLINDPVTDTQVTESPMKTVASKAYVDTKIETKQLKIPAANQPNVDAGETVMTYTATGNGQIGERGLYSDISSYDATTDGDKLITASALNATFTNLPTTDTTKLECANESDGCTLWTIVDQTAYGNGLPSGYTRLEYIQSTGTQYIDTGVNIGEDIQTKVKFGKTGNTFSRYGFIIGGGISYQGLVSRVGTNSYYSSMYDSDVSNAITMAITDDVFDFTFNVAGHKIVLNNTEVGALTPISPYPTNKNVGIFNTPGTSNNNIGIGKVYSFVITNNLTNAMLFNGIPVRRNSDNAVGMYDTVSGRFFTNAASGGDDFTAGPPVQ